MFLLCGFFGQRYDLSYISVSYFNTGSISSVMVVVVVVVVVVAFPRMRVSWCFEPSQPLGYHYIRAEDTLLYQG